ncbi:MAG: hypothetical protein DPW14_06665 [Planctomycetes bacterium]|nr:hypothetical protein [Planctomycetota bacterium]
MRPGRAAYKRFESAKLVLPADDCECGHRLPQGKALLKLWTKSLRQRLPWPHFLWHVVTRLLPF